MPGLDVGVQVGFFGVLTTNTDFINTCSAGRYSSLSLPIISIQ